MQTLIQKMKENAEKVQAVVLPVKTYADAFRYAADLTARQSGKTIAAPSLNGTHLQSLQECCQENGIEVLTSGMRDHAGRIHTAFTPADWGIAETGTLVIDSTSEDVRLATMLSEIHVAILPASKIKSESMMLEHEIKQLQASAPRYLAFITGASRTADIERVLTIGVHGPQELHILIVEE